MEFKDACIFAFFYLTGSILPPIIYKRTPSRMNPVIHAMEMKEYS
jgi:hypothetical protein